MDPRVTQAAREALDIREKGGARDGARQALDKRLFMMLSVFTGCRDAQPLAQALEEERVPGVLYLDANDPRGVGLLAFHEDPAYFTAHLRGLLGREPFAALAFRPELAMLGRTYAIGYEPDLADWLLARPRRVVLDPGQPWALWYPLRRTGAFAALAREEQMQILKEHGAVGRAFGDAGLAQDIRLACHGLGTSDNDFIIGLVGRELHPLSAVVERMRTTRQTSQFIAGMGPFFVGRALWQSPPP